MASKAAKAKASRSKEKKLAWNGLKFDLPPELPETVLFDFADIEASSQSGNPYPVFRLLRSILGAVQFGKLRSAVDTGDVKSDEIFDLLTEILPKYGLTLGESSASASS